MGAAAAVRKPVVEERAAPERLPSRGFLKLEDQDCDEAYRGSTSKAQFRAFLLLLRRTYSAPGSPRATAASYPEIAQALNVEECTAVRIMTDMAARGWTKCWAVGEAVENGLMKMPRGIDPRTNAWEPLREKWPSLPGADEIERPAKEPKAPREIPASSTPVTLDAGGRIQPIQVQPEDKEIAARVKEGSAPIAFEVYKEDGVVEIVAFAEPAAPPETTAPAVEIPGIHARERKAKTLENKAVIAELLSPYFLRLFNKDVDDELAGKIAHILGPTPLPLYESLIDKRLLRYKGRAEAGIFAVWAEDARKQYGNLLYIESLRPLNGHSAEASSRFQTVFAPWCAKRGLDPSRTESADLFQQETGEDVFA
jgi:hypothetical protein